MESLRSAAASGSAAAGAAAASASKQLADMDAEMERLRKDLAAALIKSDDLQVVVDEYEKGGRKAPGSKDSVLAAQQARRGPYLAAIASVTFSFPAISFPAISFPAIFFR